MVVDASVVVAALVSGSGAGAKARERLRLDDDVHVPHLLDVEVLAALRRRVRLGQTEPGRAATAIADLRDFPALRWDHDPLLPRVWELRENVTAYDGTYVALAELLACPFVTSDGRLARAPAVQCPVELLDD